MHSVALQRCEFRRMHAIKQRLAVGVLLQLFLPWGVSTLDEAVMDYRSKLWFMHVVHVVERVYEIKYVPFLAPIWLRHDPCEVDALDWMIVRKAHQASYSMQMCERGPPTDTQTPVHRLARAAGHGKHVTNV